MAHFAEIDSNNKVLRVLVVPNEQENRGQEYLADELNMGGTWIQTSYNANFGVKYAAIDDVWDAERNAFISPKPYESWVLNEQTCSYEAPIAKTSGKYHWSEDDLSWREVPNE